MSEAVDAEPRSGLGLLLAKQEISELMTRYCRGVDRMDLALVRSVYHPGAVDHHSGYDGDVDGFIAWLSMAMESLGGTTHLTGGQHIEIVGRRAVSETYGTCRHWGTPLDDPKLNFVTGVRYVDSLEEREGRWGIVERWAVRDWIRADVAPRPLSIGMGPQGRRGDLDPIHAARRTLVDRPASL